MVKMVNFSCLLFDVIKIVCAFNYFGYFCTIV